MTGRLRTGCLWVAGAWFYFGLVIGLVDMDVNDPNDRLVQVAFWIVLMASVIALTVLALRRFWRGRS